MTKTQNFSVIHIKQELGQALTEYALILALVSIAGIMALTTLGSTTNGLFGNIVNRINGEGTDTPTPTPAPQVLSIENAAIADIEDQVYTGSPITPEPVVTFNDTKLISGTDYTYSYENNTNVGIGTVNVTGKGNYTGSRTVNFTITAAKLSLESAVIATVSDQTYTGSSIKPEPKVTINSAELVKGTDFEFAYSNNMEVGNATITISGKGSYTGTKSITFKIVSQTSGDYITISGGSEIAIICNSPGWDGTMYYSTDAINWNVWTGSSIQSGTGKKIYLRGKGNTTLSTNSSFCSWSIAGTSVSVHISGNIETLLDYETAAAGGETALTTDGSFAYLFYNNSLITSTEGLVLPRMNLTAYCYSNLFKDCYNLKNVPALPATTLTDYCYFNMFKGCTSLKLNSSGSGTAFSIPSSGTATLGTESLKNMFANTGGNVTTPSINTTYYIAS